MLLIGFYNNLNRSKWPITFKGKKKDDEQITAMRHIRIFLHLGQQATSLKRINLQMLGNKHALTIKTMNTFVSTWYHCKRYTVGYHYSKRQEHKKYPGTSTVVND